MRELIYSIENIFNHYNQDGCLTQYESEFFHIPAYQRGYKWASTDNGAVTILLNDIWEAFNKFLNQEKKEYFLQYITVKRIQIDKVDCLEIIDGQQRLTTLSILLSVIALKLNVVNIAENKLDYAVRDNFFNEQIYSTANLSQLINQNWHELISKNPHYDKQDIYYMFEAVLKCNAFLQNKANLHTLYSYILSNVKLIVNSVETHIESETVFKNLNSNKVPLTETELIKGLIITKVGRSNNGVKKKQHFKEIMEIRMNVGRLWDEINIWANTPTIKNFFFNNKADAMHELLSLTALIIDESNTKLNNESKDFPLFNIFLKQNDYTYIFNRLVDIKKTLENWYYNTEVYNLLGYCRFAKNSGFNNLVFLKSIFTKKDKQALLIELKNKKDELIKNINFDDINFHETPDKIHQILLAINIFTEGQKNIRFDFYAFENEDWSLEHIFPQTPEGKKNVLSKENREAILKILDNHSTEVYEVLQLESRTEEQKQIYYSALKEHPALNSIANICLLTGGNNASNGNKFFNEKRENILNLIQKGSFVPKHTFDVFSKMFNNADTENMKIWSIDDMDAHLAHIKTSIGFEEKDEEEQIIL